MFTTRKVAAVAAATALTISTGAILRTALGVGSIAAIGAGVYFAPEIHAALTNAGIQLPPLPWTPAQDAAPAAPAPAPGPGADNGRG
ncbi:hypothetical protein NCCP2495_22790 [Dietzia sp. NCCP-2495]|uniref:hypothetical protein n=1 Tax=Dietzia sp. NCCP-2495 TaxID=2934675 RepID=UPI002230D52C|nr:hypothetical protein [Dietzia sp. NCCP-2495]GLB64400.1 hypothetical protein NCCP2495_22790 [Dietzia sp. NCCP-2495]